MLNLKKLAVSPLFLFSFAFLCYRINLFLSSTDTLFSLDLASLIAPIILSAIILLTCYFFVLFATLAQDWILVGVTILIAGILPIIFLPSPASLYMAIGTVLSLVVIFARLLNKLKTYLTFQPSVLLSPSIKNLASLIALIISIIYFQSVSMTIQEKGVHFFDPMIDSFSNAFNVLDSAQNDPANLDPTTLQEKINQLKANPEIARQYGIDPKTLNNPAILNEIINRTQADKTSSTQSNLAKELLGNTLKPYLSFVAPTLAILMFFALTGPFWIIGLLITPLLWGTFSLLKSTGFVKFTTEMREVKKLVV